MRWNTVLFDLDGTVTDPKEGITCAVAYALRQQGIIADPDTLTSFIGPPLHESFPELFGLTEEQTDRAVEDFRVYFSRQGWAENIPYKGMAELLESLQGAGLKLVIATVPLQITGKPPPIPLLQSPYPCGIIVSIPPL